MSRERESANGFGVATNEPCLPPSMRECFRPFVRRRKSVPQRSGAQFLRRANRSTRAKRSASTPPAYRSPPPTKRPRQEQARRGRACCGRGVGLGQHRFAFMAEIIDEALASGSGATASWPGLTTRWSRTSSTGRRAAAPWERSSSARSCTSHPTQLAVAVAPRTRAEVIAPLAPRLMGALGIALLALEDLPVALHWRGGPAQARQSRPDRRAAARAVVQSTRNQLGEPNARPP